MRQIPLLIGAIVAIVSTGCSPCADGTSNCEPGGMSSGEGNSPPDACAAGAACGSGKTFCCNGAESLSCAGGIYAQVAWCKGESESCDPNGGGCLCPPGAKRCIQQDPTQIQTCVSSGGKFQFQASPCPKFQYCKASDAACVSCLDECLVGDVECSEDKRFVKKCKKLGATDCKAAVWVLDFSCADKNMFCNKPSFTPSSDLDFCVNECGGRGIVLQGSECSIDPNVSCSVLYCNAATGQLEGDHAACLAAGTTCFADNQCASCNCTATTSMSGVCIGNTIKPCPTQNPCP